MRLEHAQPHKQHRKLVAALRGAKLLLSHGPTHLLLRFPKLEECDDEKTGTALSRLDAFKLSLLIGLLKILKLYL